MEYKKFEFTSYAKCVLAGEHAVLRGGQALVLPQNDFQMNFKFTPSEKDKLEILPSPFAPYIQEALKKAFSFKAISNPVYPKGSLELTSTIPISSGLGSSAAFCVALMYFLKEHLNLKNEEELEFAQRIEDIFHGKSSGMDVAAVYYNKPILYSQKTKAVPLKINKLPKFKLVETGIHGETKKCIAKVNDIIKKDPERGKSIDLNMEEAVKLAKNGLLSFNEGKEEEALELISKSLNLSFQCYKDWNLIPEKVLTLREKLLEKGALAVRLTGSGDGGFLLALINEK